jgi:hypothetical protein
VHSMRTSHSAPAISHASAREKTILVVDDDEVVRYLLEQLARLTGQLLHPPRFLFVSGFFPLKPDYQLPGPLLPKPFPRGDLLATVQQLMTSAAP